MPRNFCTSNKGTLLPRPGSNGHFATPSRLDERILGDRQNSRQNSSAMADQSMYASNPGLYGVFPARTWSRIRACMGTCTTLPAFCFRGAAAFAGSALRAF